MFLNVEKLNLEQLVEKQIELRQKLVQASNMGMQGPAAQIQNMLDQVSIEIKAKSQIQVLDKEREKKIEDGEDPNPDNDVFNIGVIE